jgi:hypothetical protein
MQANKDQTATFGSNPPRNEYDPYANQSSIKAGSYASLPKNIKSKLNLPIRPSTSGMNPYSQVVAHQRSKSPSIQQIHSNQYPQEEEAESLSYYRNPISFKNTMRSSSRGKMVTAKKNKLAKSPPSQVYKSYSRCHKYHTDLDYNYLFDQKFHNEALHCAKDKITTKALKDCSPDKYYYNRSQSPEIVKSRLDYINLNKSIQESRRHLEEYYNNSTEVDKKLKSSRGIISNVVDSQFSPNSPSKLKLYHDEMSQMRNEENTEKYNLNLSRNNSQEIKDKIYVDDNTRLTINLSFVGENPSERYLDALEAVMSVLDPIFERCTLNEKIEKFLEISDDHRRAVRLGALAGLYSICMKYDLDDEYKIHIIEKVTALIQNYEIQEELFLVACLEILSIYAPNELLLQNMNLICMFLTDFNYPKLQKAAFHCIMCMEYEGIKVF